MWRALKTTAQCCDDHLFSFFLFCFLSTPFFFFSFFFLGDGDGDELGWLVMGVRGRRG